MYFTARVALSVIVLMVLVTGIGWSQLHSTGATPPPVSQGLPASFTVYPNPAIDHATLDYTIPADAHARVRLYDAVGREVALLAELHSNPTGHIAVGFDGLASGVYTIAIEGAEGVIASRPITISR